MLQIFAGLSILLGIDRIPDMFRSMTNLLGQITTAVVVDGWVGDGQGRAPAELEPPPDGPGTD